MPEEVMAIREPLVIMFEDKGAIICHIHPSRMASSHREYGVLICDLVRHVAHAFEVEEDEVWEWVDTERRDPTSEISRPS